MFVLIGIGIVFGSVFVGYTIHGGKISVLIQISEIIIIGGAALGSIIVGYSPKGAIEMIKACLDLLKGNPFKKAMFLDLLQAMYELFVLARKEGPLAIEKHVENPHESSIFQKYPSFLQQHHAVDLCADTLKVVAMGGINVHDLSDLMDLDIESQHEDAMRVPNMFGTVGDAMPGFGIVAAVLGVVITMQAIGGPPEQIGEKVAAALVGTFLGVLLSYGVFGPLSKATEAIVRSEGQYLACVKYAIVAFARGDNPLTCVEFARRNIELEVRPSFSELEDACKSRSRASAAGGEVAQAA